MWYQSLYRQLFHDHSHLNYFTSMPKFVVIQGPDGVAGMKGDTGDDGNAVRLCTSLKITHAVALQI